MSIRIWRSPYADFHSDMRKINTLECETIRADKIYDEEMLRSIAENGFNGIWVHALLHQLVKHPEFPEFGEFEELQIASLSALVKRAAFYGIKVYLYMQPPRAFRKDDPFWNAHPDVVGSTRSISWDSPDNVIGPMSDYVSLCTSTEKVRAYLHDAVARLATLLPGLGGYLVISASEFPAQCCTVPAGQMKHPCPRCFARGFDVVIPELLNTLYRGMRDVSDTQELIAWNWSWPPDVAENILRRLDPGIIVMADFERGGTFPMPGHPHHLIDEYALCYPGPAERFLGVMDAADRAGLRKFVKFQIGTTHENGAVPCLPVIPNIYSRADWLRKNNAAGFLGCWNFGNFLSVNTAAFNRFLDPDIPGEPVSAMRKFASEYFPGCDADKTVRAWILFADAMKNYPHIIPFLYWSPTSFTLGHFIPPGPLGIAGGMTWGYVRERGDDISEAFRQEEFSVEECVSLTGKLADVWDGGVRLLHESLATSDSPHAAAEYGNAVVCGCCWRSLRNFLTIYRIKKEKGVCDGEEYASVMRSELAVTERALPYVEADPRIGYHSEAHAYNFTPEMMREKIKKIRALGITGTEKM